MAKPVGLNFSIQYKKGQQNMVADALSRFSHNATLNAISGCIPVWIQEALNSYAVDPKAQLLTELCIVNSNSLGYSLTDGLIKHKKKTWVGSNTALQTKIIHAFHSSAMGGHSGVQATYQHIKKLFAWQGLKDLVEDFIKQCNTYQQAKHELCKIPGLLSPLPILDGFHRSLTKSEWVFCNSGGGRQIY